MGQVRSLTSEMLRYMIAIADAGSISGAAATANISQPALSQCMAEVEKELGQKLFARLNRGVELTDCGRIFINNARAMLFVEEQMARDLAKLKAKEHNCE